MKNVEEVTPNALIFNNDGKKSYDPKDIAVLGPFDYNTSSGPGTIKLGLVCKNDHADRLHSAIKGLNSKVKSSRGGEQNFPSFEKAFKSNLNIPNKYDQRFQKIPENEYEKLEMSKKPILQIVNLYKSYMEKIPDDVNVVLVYLPKILQPYESFEGHNLRACLKAVSAKMRKRTQIVKEYSFVDRSDKASPNWNLSLGLYVKGGGVPWKIQELSPGDCFIGISFARGKKDYIHGALQIIDKYGTHLDLRRLKLPVDSDSVVDTTEKGVHISEEKMSEIVQGALDKYERTLKSKPENLIIHKTSSFLPCEERGVMNVLGSIKAELVHIKLNNTTRLLSEKDIYPPEVGTFVKINENRGFLCCTGKVEKKSTYPGAGVPRPVELERPSKESSDIRNVNINDIETVAQQALSLTRMDWNNFDMMIREPITIKYARKITRIIKEEDFTPGGSIEVEDIVYYI